jgi:calcium permeable stress-gated cation channel
MACCILAVIFASTFSLIFPLIGPAVVLLVLLTLIAHRFLVGYVYARTHSQTGGLLQMWLLRRFATLTALQPLVLGLILLSRRLWPEGGALTLFSALVVLFSELYCARKLREPGVKRLSPITREALAVFEHTARPNKRRNLDEESTDLVSERSNVAQRMRASYASVLDMMSITLAVAPPGTWRGVVPLRMSTIHVHLLGADQSYTATETIDDLTATERAARTHPDAPPHLPPLSFTDSADQTAGVLYPPELIAPAPTIWLPADSAGVARGEAHDLERYHGLRAVVDVRSREDVERRSSVKRRPTAESTKTRAPRVGESFR